MKNTFAFGIGATLFIAFVSLFVFSVRVEPGYAGILVDNWGRDKGVQVESLPTGRNYYNPFTHDYYKFPTFIQQLNYRNVNFQDTDGLAMKATVGVAYKFDGTKVPKLFEEFRKSASYITDNYMQTWVRNSMMKVASTYPVDEIYGEKKEEFRQAVREDLNEYISKKGMILDDIFFSGEIEIPELVQTRINAKIEATQEAMQKENELRATVAEAEKTIAYAEGVKQAKILEGEGIAEFNRLLQESLSNNVIEFKKLENAIKSIEKWNGKYPDTYMGSEGAIPLIQISTSE